MMWDEILYFLFIEVQDGLKLNGTHQLLSYVDDVNILGEEYVGKGKGSSSSSCY